MSEDSNAGCFPPASLQYSGSLAVVLTRQLLRATRLESEDVMSAPAPPQRLVSALKFSLFFSVAFLAVAFATSCGSGRMPGASEFSGNTQVTVTLTSTANDQLVEYDVGFSSITLTGQSGKTVTLLPASTSGSGPGAEFMHLNGREEPLLTATIPQDVYTSATIAISNAEFVCVALGLVDGEQTLSTAFYNSNVPTVTVDLRSPITVTGTSMALSLDLLVSQSETIGSCLNVDGFAGFSIMPTFLLAPQTLLSAPTSAANGRVMGLDGQITTIETAGNWFTLSLPSAEGPRTLSVTTDDSTLYQGIGGISALAVGTFVNMDGAIQADGSLLATRVAVPDPSAADVLRGPVLEVDNAVSTAFVQAREQHGKDFPGYEGGEGYAVYGNANFQISGQLTNLASLPFVAAFNPSSIVPGQEVYVSVSSIAFNGYTNAATMTLMPQTINATVLASAQVGNFTDYTVSLASYDLFPMLALQPAQTTIEYNPSQVEVYVDENTQMLNTQTLAAGSTFRFYGLVFNDNGTLRMDCAQVNDGVAFSVPPSASQQNHMRRGDVRQTRRMMPGGSPQIISVIKAEPQP